MTKVSPTWSMLALHLPWLVIFFILPITFVAWLSLQLPAGINSYTHDLSLTNFDRLTHDPYPRIAAISLGYAILTTILCICLALPLAWAISLAPSHWRNPLLVIIMLPFWASALIRVFSLQHILGRHGILNSLLEKIWQMVAIIFPLDPFTPLPLLYNEYSVLVGLIYTFLPFAILPLYTAVARIDTLLLATSRDLGSTHWQAFRFVVLPLAMPGILSAGILICIPALGSFFVAEMLGGPSDLLIGNIIERQFKKSNDWPFGAALSVTMIAMTFIFLEIVRRVSSSKITDV